MKHITANALKTSGTQKPDPVRENLRSLLAERGIDMATLSRAIGKNHAYIQQYLTRGIPTHLSYQTAISLAQYFGASLTTFGINAPASTAPTPNTTHPIKTLRSMLNLSPDQFASALAVTAQDIADIENFKTPLTENLLLRICHTFRIAPDELRQYIPPFSDDERNLIYRLRRLTPAQRQIIDNVLQKIDTDDQIRTVS